MPKIKPTPEARYLTQVAANLRYYVTLAGITPDRLATAAHVSKSTAYKRLRDPSGLTLAEMIRLAAALHVRPAALLEERSA